MMKSLKTMMKQDKEQYKVPKTVQDYVPITSVYEDGIFKVGNRFTKTFKFEDINYLVAGKEDKEIMFLAYSELLNSLDSGATTKMTINNRKLNRAEFERNILMPERNDALDVYRTEYNDMLREKSAEANGIVQEKYITIAIVKKDVEEARTYFARVGSDL
ncbi:MAG: TraE family protein, partial [Clostridia bacterium]|nr:TraE family protein [Clostridia bacterium]